MAIVADAVASRSPETIGAPSWGWWLSRRQAWPVDVFRFACGALVFRYFANMRGALPILVGRDGLVEPLGTFVGRLGPGAIDAALIAAMSLSALLALGLWPRLCAAALFVWAVACSRALSIVTISDDVVVCLALFWLVLLPTGTTLRLVAVGSLRRWRQARVDGGAVNVFLAQVLFLTWNVSFWRAFGPLGPGLSWVAMGMWLSPVCLVLPSFVANRLGVVTLAAVHGYLFARSAAPSHGILAASTFMFWGERVESERAGAAPPFGLAASIGAVALLVEGLHGLGGVLHAPSLTSASLHVLSDSGLTPVASGRKPPNERVALELVSATGPARSVPLPWLSASERIGMLLEQWAGDSLEGEAGARAKLAARLGRRICAGDPAPVAPSFLVLVRGERRERVAWLDCAGAAGGPAVVLLGASSVTNNDRPREEKERP